MPRRQRTNRPLYKFFKKAWITKQIIRFQGDDTAAYKEVREDVVNPQNLLHKLRKNSENSTDRGISSCEKNFSVQKRYMNFSRQRKMPLDVLLYEFFLFFTHSYY